MGDGVKQNPLVIVPDADQFSVRFKMGPDYVQVARCDTAQAAADRIAAADLGPKSIGESIARIGAARWELTDLCEKHPEKIDPSDGPVPPKPPKGPAP